MGCCVADTAAVGLGFPDLVVATPRGRTLLLEVKDGDLPPSARTLTPPQRRFHAAWTGELVIVGSVEEALAAVGIRSAA